MKKKSSSSSKATRGKRERYIQPSLLMVLYRKPSHGYELIHDIKEFGFIKGQAPPGMIYRHLRQLEEDKFVTSVWETNGSGPARRMYSITPEGKDLLAGWIAYMENQVKNLNEFVRRYQAICEGRKKGNA